MRPLRRPRYGWSCGRGSRVVVLLLNTRLQTKHGGDVTRLAAQTLYCSA